MEIETKVEGLVAAVAVEKPTHKDVGFKTRGGKEVTFKASTTRKTTQEKKERLTKKIIADYQKGERKRVREEKRAIREANPPKRRRLTKPVEEPVAESADSNMKVDE